MEESVNAMQRPNGTAAICWFLALALTAVSGCAATPSENIVFDNGAQDTAPETKLTFFGYKYEALNVTAIEDALHGFMEEHPQINIAYDGIKSPEYFDVLVNRIATGNSDDIIMVDHERVLELGSQGMLADLSDLSTLEYFNDLARSQMAAGGTINYLPTSISAFGLYCNTDLLKAYGQEIPENWAEFAQVCDFFAAQGIVPIVANNDISLKTIVLAKGMLPYYQQADAAAAVSSLNGNPQALSESLLPGFQQVEQMLAHGWVDAQEALVTAKTKDDLTLFAQGTRPFMLTGAWAVPRVRALNPAFAFEVRAYPILDDGSVLVVNVDTRVSVRADSPHVEEAKQFVEYLTRQDVMWAFVDSQCSFSPLTENRLAEDPAIQSIGPYLTNGRSVIGADDNLKYPLWDAVRQCIVGMLEGDSAQQACGRLEALLHTWESQMEVETP